MAMQEQNITLFHAILHGLIRHNDSDEEVARTTKVAEWAMIHLTPIVGYCTDDQKRLLGVYGQHWLEHKSVPSRINLGKMVNTLDKPDGILDMLRSYDEWESTLEQLDVYDMPLAVEDYYQDWRSVTWRRTLRLANSIVIQGEKIDKNSPPLKGVEDSIRYIMEMTQSGMVLPENRALGGDVPADAKGIMDEFDRKVEEAKVTAPRLLTGILAIDDVIDIKRGQFWGILGYAGQRKSAWARSIAYNMVMDGRSVMYIPLEQDYIEERMIYGAIHANHARFRGYAKVPVRRLDNADLSKREEDFLRNTVIPDFRDATLGTLIVRQPVTATWEDVKMIVEMQNRITPLDVLIVDYLALLRVEGRDQREAMNHLIQDAKVFCRTFNNNRGLTLITPVQGKREAYEEAVVAMGKWQMSGVYSYSEFDRSLDGCLYIFMDDGMKTEGEAKVGSCKSRRSGDIPPTIVSINPESGYVTDRKMTGSGSNSSNNQRTKLPDSRDLRNA